MALSTTPLPAIIPGSVAVKPRAKNTIVHPFDPVDNNASVWFPDTIGTSSVRAPNEVIPYINGREAFKDVVSAIRTATLPQHFIYLLGWLLTPDFPLIDGDRSTTVRALFTVASSYGVDIRAMLFHHSSLSNDSNAQAIKVIEQLPTGKAIHDDRVVEGNLLAEIGLLLKGAKYVGVHHQKMLLINGEEGLIAFQGGMDLHVDRLHFPYSKPPDPPAPFGLHDVHTRIRGLAALSLFDVFVERWSDHPRAKQYPPIPSTITTPDVPGDLQVQIGRTYANTASHSLYGPGGPYRFAPSGVQSAKAIVLNAISQSRNFIYIEDQYLFDMSISNALKAALPNIKKLIILVCDSRQVFPDTHQPFLRRRYFINNLTGGAPLPTPKVIVCKNATGSTVIPYVHSKTFIFDDKFIVTGSANLTRRGYTHDSEQNAGIFDNNKDERFFFPHEIRMHLWAKLLNKRAIDMVDPIASSVHWTKPIGNIVTYDLNGQDPPKSFGEVLLGDDLVWDNGLDPDGS